MMIYNRVEDIEDRWMFKPAIDFGTMTYNDYTALNRYTYNELSDSDILSLLDIVDDEYIKVLELSI